LQNHHLALHLLFFERRMMQKMQWRQQMACKFQFIGIIICDSHLSSAGPCLVLGIVTIDEVLNDDINWHLLASCPMLLSLL
jgi:hypothetical protein